MKFWENTYYGNDAWVIAVAAGFAALTFFILFFIKERGSHKLAAMAEKTKNQADDLLAEFTGRIHIITILALSIYIGSRFLTLPDFFVSSIPKILAIVLCLQGAWWGNGLITRWARRSLENENDEPEEGPSLTAIAFFIRLALWSVVLLVMLDNLGVDISVLMAGLGVGGIAIALATQNILGDVFNSVAIMLDKPFEVGDYIVVGDFMGEVEHIGVKTTRVKSLQGEQIIFSNADLVSARIRNFKTMIERRILFRFGVVYQTPANKLEAIPDIIREIIDGQNLSRCDRVHFSNFGDSALNFEVVYYVKSGDYAAYMDTQQEINFAIFRKFEDEGIEFAYPTQTVYMNDETATPTAVV